jgi:hypothetical protein
MPLPVPDDRNPSPKAATNPSVLRKCISLQPFPNILTFFWGQLREFFEDFLDYSLRDFNLSICPRDRSLLLTPKKKCSAVLESLSRFNGARGGGNRLTIPLAKRSI